MSAFMKLMVTYILMCYGENVDRHMRMCNRKVCVCVCVRMVVGMVWKEFFFFFEKMICEQNSGRISKEKNILGRLEE